MCLYMHFRVDYRAIFYYFFKKVDSIEQYTGLKDKDGKLEEYETIKRGAENQQQEAPNSENQQQEE